MAVVEVRMPCSSRLAIYELGLIAIIMSVSITMDSLDRDG